MSPNKSSRTGTVSSGMTVKIREGEEAAIRQLFNARIALFFALFGLSLDETHHRGPTSVTEFSGKG